jgi:hypothetical protein
MPTRLLNQNAQPTKRAIQAPNRRDDWKQLLTKAIARAEASGDRRAIGLKQALINGEAERHLRRLGIIHEGDLLREFPVKKP